jgi:hypothetical protein
MRIVSVLASVIAVFIFSGTVQARPGKTSEIKIQLRDLNFLPHKNLPPNKTVIVPLRINVPVFSEAGFKAGSQFLFSVMPGQKIRILERVYSEELNVWYKVKTPNGAGFILSDTLNFLIVPKGIKYE